MEILILSPPVCTPAEPPSGAFVLAAALAGHGKDVALFDLSLEFYHRVLSDNSMSTVPINVALDYLLNCDGAYDPMKHRTAAGSIHKKLKSFSSVFPGWHLTAMDISPPEHVHHLEHIERTLQTTRSPFEELWIKSLMPVLEQHRPKKIIVSLAYLSQLPAAIDLAMFLKKRGIVPQIGGSLPRSLAGTGQGLNALKKIFSAIDITNGASFAGLDNERDLLRKLSWPVLLSKKPYLSTRFVIPLALSVGCFWRRCLFCPDREMKFEPVSIKAITHFMSSIPSSVIELNPLIHLLDSAIPPGLLRRFLPVAKEHGVQFYGFARPTYRLLRDDLIEKSAQAGCVMLQLGVESGSGSLLNRFDKGIDPKESAQVMKRAALAGIRTYAYLLFGLPGETNANREATLLLIKDNIQHVDFLNLSLFNLPKYCELSDRSDEFDIQAGSYPGTDLKEKEAIALYTPFTCAGVSPRKEAREFLQKRFLKDPIVREAYLRTPKWFRAAHLAMMKIPNRS